MEEEMKNLASMLSFLTRDEIKGSLIDACKKKYEAPLEEMIAAASAAESPDEPELSERDADDVDLILKLLSILLRKMIEDSSRFKPCVQLLPNEIKHQLIALQEQSTNTAIQSFKSLEPLFPPPSYSGKFTEQLSQVVELTERVLYGNESDDEDDSDKENQEHAEDMQ